MLEVITLDSEITTDLSFLSRIVTKQELVANGDFEMQKTGWDVITSHNTQIGVTNEPAQVYSGVWTGVFISFGCVGSETDNVAINTGGANVKVGSKYLLSFYAINSALLPQLCIGCGGVYPMWTMTCTWEHHVAEIVAENTNKLRMFVNEGAILIDEISLKEIDRKDDSYFILDSCVTKEFNKYSRISQQLLLESPLNSE